MWLFQKLGQNCDLQTAITFDCLDRITVVSLHSRFATSRFATSRFATRIKSFRYTHEVVSLHAQSYECVLCNAIYKCQLAVGCLKSLSWARKVYRVPSKNVPPLEMAHANSTCSRYAPTSIAL